MRQRFIAGVAVAALVSGAVVLVPALPASAAAGLYRVSAVSSSDSVSPKTVTVDCDPGDKLTSVGGSVDGTNGDVLLTRAYADAALSRATASGIEGIATAANWTVTVYGVCAPAGAINGLTLVETTAGPNPNDKFVTASCPAGKVTYGAGWKLLDAYGLVSIDEVKLNAALTSVQVTSYDWGAVGDYSLTAQAICGTALANMSLSTFSSANNSVSPKTVTTNACAEVSGAGAWITGAVGAANIDTLRVKPQLEVAEVVVREVGAYGNNWDVEVQAVCLN